VPGLSLVLEPAAEVHHRDLALGHRGRIKGVGHLVRGGDGDLVGEVNGLRRADARAGGDGQQDDDRAHACLTPLGSGRRPATSYQLSAVGYQRTTDGAGHGHRRPGLTPCTVPTAARRPLPLCPRRPRRGGPHGHCCRRTEERRCHAAGWLSPRRFGRPQQSSVGGSGSIHPSSSRFRPTSPSVESPTCLMTARSTSGSR